MSVSDLPTLNAVLNLVSASLLLIGYRYIKRGERRQHKKFMISALGSSALFLTSYLIYHYHVKSVPYPHYDWTRPLYFAVLIPHVVLAAVMVPFVIAIVWLAFREKFTSHRRLARWVWPVWMFVSVSGVTVYLMLYRL